MLGRSKFAKVPVPPDWGVSLGSIGKFLLLAFDSGLFGILKFFLFCALKPELAVTS